MKLRNIVLVGCFCALLLAGCWNNNKLMNQEQVLGEEKNDTENEELVVKIENTYDYNLTAYDYEESKLGNVVCFFKNNLISYVYSENDEYITYYRHNLTDGKSYKLGDIYHPFIDKGEIIVIEEKLYFYRSEMVPHENGTDFDTIQSLYEIDVEMDTLTKLAEDELYQTLVYVDEIDNKLLTYKGNLEDGIGITFLDVYDVSEGSETEYEVIIRKEWNSKTNMGEAIRECSVDGDVIYTLEKEVTRDTNIWRITHTMCC